MRIVLLGAPGSGKGTQAKKLMSERNISHISTGDMLRLAVNSGTKLGMQAKKIMEAGQLVPDDIMVGIIRERLSEDDIKNDFVLDGFPRTENQALDLEKLLIEIKQPLDFAILMDVDSDVLLKRLTGRRTCSLTGKLLNIYFSPQSELDACLNAGGELLQREDDNEATISSRLNVYHDQTEPLIGFYCSRNLLKTLDADGEVQDIYTRLLATLGYV
jgi:adenylate kinase